MRAALAGLVMLEAGAGCKAPLDEGGTAPAGLNRARGGSANDITLSERTHRPREAPVGRYAAPVKHELSATEREILRRIGKGSFAHDPALSRMMRGLARATPSRNDMPPELVDGLLAWHGITDASPQVLIVELNPDAAGCLRKPVAACAEPFEALASSVREVLAQSGNWKIGVGVAQGPGGGTRMMVGVIDRAFAIEPIPAVAPAGSRMPFRGTLRPGLRDPDLHLVEASGRWRQLPVARGNGGRVEANVVCGTTPGVYQVELFASGDHGPEVVANFPIYCGVKRPGEITYQLERVGPKVPTRTIEGENFRALNEARRAAGLPALKWDERLAELARAHSNDMVRANFVGHVSPTTGDAAQRVRKAGIPSAVVRENIGRGYGPRSIHLSLMNSPGHRANVLAQDVTHVGIGVVYGRREGSGPDAPRPVFLTQKFIAKPGQDAPADPVAGLRTAVDKEARAGGWGPIKWDPRLSEVAQAQAEAAARGRAAFSETQLRNRVFGLGYETMVQHQVESASFRALVTMDLWLEARDRHVGFGLAQTPDKQRFVLLVYLAK